MGTEVSCPSPKSNVSYRPVRRLAVALPQDHAMAGMTRIRLGSLAEEEFVMFSRQVSPLYFDSLVASCRASGFSPRIIHEVRSVASQIAFVSCGQGIALVPSALKKLAPENVVIRALRERVNVVTTAMAWSTARQNPMVNAVLALLDVEGTGATSVKRAPRRQLRKKPGA